MAVNAVGPDELIGEVVDGRYTVLEQIAVGGMASVYRAVDTRLERDVALKVMKPHLANDTEFVSRFHREAKAAARLAHPNVVGVYDQGEDHGRVFLVMEYVPGRTFREVIEADAPLAPRTALDLLDPMLQALAVAHEAGFVHRDVKPENVIVRTDGVIKVADFGLARAVTSATATSVGNDVLGTLSYIAPEQVKLSEATTRSDVYAAGLILFELLTGRKAVVGDSIPNVLYQHLHQDVPAPSTLVPGIPPDVDRLVAHATTKAPARRPADAGEFLAEVRHVLATLAPNPAPGARRRALASSPTEVIQVPPSVTGPPRLGDTARYAVPPPHSPATWSPGATSHRTTPGGAHAPDATPPGTHPSNPHGSLAHPGGTAAPGAHPVGIGASAKPRRRRGGWIALLLLTLTAAATAGWFFLAGPGAPATVPRLTALTVDAARESLAQAHLGDAVTEAFDESVADGVVVSSTPGAGAELHRGDVVTLTVSKGPERYGVPTLVGLTRAMATTSLANVNLEVGRVREKYSDTVKAGVVLSSDPISGTPLKRGAPVALVLSKGPPPIDVPNLTGKTLAEAKELVAGLGLVLAEGEQVFSDTIAKGQVAVADPASGQVLRGATITISLSKGPELFEVPSVFRKSEKEARKILTEAGFEVKVDYFLGGPLDMVTGQTPASGTMAPKGTLVVITVV